MENLELRIENFNKAICWCKYAIILLFISVNINENIAQNDRWINYDGTLRPYWKIGKNAGMLKWSNDSTLYYLKYNKVGGGVDSAYFVYTQNPRGNDIWQDIEGRKWFKAGVQLDSLDYTNVTGGFYFKDSSGFMVLPNFSGIGGAASIYSPFGDNRRILFVTNHMGSVDTVAFLRDIPDSLGGADSLTYATRYWTSQTYEPKFTTLGIAKGGTNTNWFTTGKFVKYNGTKLISTTYDSTSFALINQTMYLGTTAVAINRGSGALTLNGVSIDGNASTATFATTATSATTATNLAGGAALKIAYQTAPNTTGFINAPTTASVLGSNGVTMSWLDYSPSNYANYIVARDNNGDFAARIITGTLSGNASGLSGGLAWKVPYQTGAGVTAFSVALASNEVLARYSIPGSGDGVGGYPFASTNTASTIVARDASGNFAAGTITATLSGNASTVTNGVYTNANNSLTGNNTTTGSVMLDGEVESTPVGDGNQSVSGKNSIIFYMTDAYTITLTSPTEGQFLWVSNDKDSPASLVLTPVRNGANASLTLLAGNSVKLRYRQSETTWYATGQ